MVGRRRPEQSAAVREALAYADRWLAFRQEYLQLPGLQVAVGHDGETVLSTAYGRADVERDVPLTGRHLFRIASHSKTVTATVVMRLVEAGRLRLDDRLDAYVPEAAGQVGAATVQELLGHTAGLVRDTFDGDFWQHGRPFPDREELRALAARDDAAVLGRNERLKYSNVGYGLLGLVIEAVTGTSYAEAVDEHVVAPLGLTDTGAEYDEGRADDYAVGYSALVYRRERVPIDHVHTAALAAATGCWSTASDLVTYFGAHLPGDTRLLSEDGRRRLQHGGWDVAGEPVGGPRRYGLGFAVSAVGDRTVVGHGGGYPGHSTASGFERELGLVAAVLINAIDGSAEGLLHGVFKLVFAAVDDAVATPSGAARFTGRFVSLWGVRDVALLGGRLFLVDPAAGDPVDSLPELSIVDEQTLRIENGSGYGAVGESLVYTFDPAGEIVSVRGPSAATMAPVDRFVLPARVGPGWSPLGTVGRDRGAGR